MRGKQTLVINGKVYDAVTGLPVATPDISKHELKSRAPASTSAVAARPAPLGSPAPRLPHHAKKVHGTAKKSSTLRREFLAKPTPNVQTASLRRKPTTGHVARSEMIQKFASHPQPMKQAIRPSGAPRLDITPVKPKVASIVSQKQSLVTPPTHKAVQSAPQTASIREALITERLASVDVSASPKTTKKSRKLFAKQPRMASMASLSLAILVLAGYFTYLNMPGLSVRVAAAQADIAAGYPDYHPDGYTFNGPVAYASGQVAIDFNANGGNMKYTLTQQKSTWDSQAVYDNIVAKAADDSYVTNSQQGLTIYTFKGDAAWVNKGILYTISGDAPLSNEQLLRIAGSL